MLRDEFMPPEKNQTDLVFYVGVRYLCPILTKFRTNRQIFKKAPNIKFHGNTSSASHADTRGQTDMT